jgi:hypothetical protein
MNSALGTTLRTLSEDSGFTLDELTVLSASNDPFRLDTEKFHTAGAWLRDQMGICGLLNRDSPIHNRGIHYALVSHARIIRPGGKPYINDDVCWQWLQDVASKAARWLRYVPFNRIIDARNSEPVIRVWGPDLAPTAHVHFYDAVIPSLKPYLDLKGTIEASQPYRLVFWGEKTSLEEVLSPLAEEFEADLYLPSGEISDSMLAKMARIGSGDGREMVVLVFADCDPAGYQMAVSIAHKLRALKEFLYPDLRFRVSTPALTVAQVKELGLPSTPLKKTELRAEGWRERYGVEQTEIDALATLRPDLLKDIVRQSAAPFFDPTLYRRKREALNSWQAAARQAFNAALASTDFAALRDDLLSEFDGYRDRLRELGAIVDDLNVDWPESEPPVPETGILPEPLISSEMPLIAHIRTLRDRKNYSGAAA